MNTAFAVVVGAGLLLIAVLVGQPLLVVRRRARLAGAAPGRRDRALLRRHLPQYRRLPAPLRRRLEQRIAVFLGEKEFVGCRGLTVTPSMRLLITAQACLLGLGRDQHGYDRLRAVLIYPAQFVVPERWEDEDGVVTEEERVLAGQAWDVSRILLSWADVRQAGGAEPYNVVIHEFAHYLDHEAGGDDGVPWLPSAAAREQWRTLLERELADLRAVIARGAEPWLDPYAAEDAGEFFAVASEAFFEQPRELAARHPQLYRGLAAGYGLDPAAW
ncbi:MAG: zinc-dependent peptidase [Gammaproteobacteria bacterium]|nr:zinc-dependent peptidase [Gammaproteobacteria bacterium]